MMGIDFAFELIWDIDIGLNHSSPDDPHWVGIICTQANVHDIIHEAIGLQARMIYLP
jgi:hypothetical protein